MLMGAACMPLTIAAPHVPEAWMAIAATCFLTFGHAFWVSNLQAIPTDLFRSGRWARPQGSQEWEERSEESSRTWEPGTS